MSRLRRPCGGFSPDMIDYAYSTDVYKIWADMIAFDHTDMPVRERSFCAFAGRRDGKHFVLSHEDLLAKYGSHIRMSGRLPEVLARAMGNQIYIATFPTYEEMEAFYADVLKTWDSL